MNVERLTLDSRELVNRLVVEASAGTGKTFSVAGLVTHALAVRDDLRISEILITTFTRNAAAELRDRVRRRIIDVARALEAVGEPVDDSADPVLVLLLASGLEPLVMANRLRRAESEFDASTISTIHGVCNRILTLAGRGTVDMGDGGETDDLVSRAVNDALVADAVGAKALVGVSEDRLIAVVKAALAIDEPSIQLHTSEHLDAGLAGALDQVVRMVVGRVRRESELRPSYDDLVRLAADLVANDVTGDIGRRFRERYRLAFVDEAQDTDDQQWRLFHAAFPKDIDDDRALVAVGDPKQAIYSFRGADVQSYLDIREDAPVRSLSENQRSDSGLVTALNALFEGAEFGVGIEYETVSAAERNGATRARGSRPLELIDIGAATNQNALVSVTASRVVEILDTCRIALRDDPDRDEPVRPDQVCVLVGARHVGRMIEAELRRRGVPAVSNGTESVMAGSLAKAFRVMLEALERPGDVGRVRRLAATPFVGVRLTDPKITDDAYISELQSRVSSWASVLRRWGVSAFGARLSSDPDVVTALTRGDAGERHLADLAHVVDLMHGQSSGEGISPAGALEIFSELESVDDTSETVSRRIESDSDSVQIMTIHSAKGLQFPFVVVADLWKAEKGRDSVPVYRVDTPDGARRRVDIGWAAGSSAIDAESKASQSEKAIEERGRLLYVAMTRPEHHVTLIHTTDTDEPSVVDRCTTIDNVRSMADLVSLRTAAEITVVGRTSRPRASTDVELSVAQPPTDMMPALSRTSFSGIVARQSGRVDHSADFRAPGAGNDELAPDISAFTNRGPRYASSGVPVTDDQSLEMPLARVPGGTHFGTVMHSVYEDIDPSAVDVTEQIERAVRRHVTSPTLKGSMPEITRGVELSVTTPLGGAFGRRSLAGFTAADRLCELDFEMSVAALTDGVMVSDLGRLLVELLPADDILAGYAKSLCDRSFDVALGGVVNGSIDAVLRIRDDGPGGRERLFITDYKTNRLDTDGDATVIEAYRPDRLLAAMEHHHYPLQAIIYGTAMHRYVSWRRGGAGASPEAEVAGVAYFFVRGMIGPDTPGVTEGAPYGVFHWTPPAGLWDALSATLRTLSPGGVR